LEGEDLNPNDHVTMGASNAPPGAEFTIDFDMRRNFVQHAITWTPSTFVVPPGDASRTFTSRFQLKAEEEASTYMVLDITVLQKASAPTNITFSGAYIANSNMYITRASMYTMSTTTTATGTTVAATYPSMEENTYPGLVIGFLSTKDPDPTDIHTYTLIDDANGRVAMDMNGGTSGIVLSGSTPADFETEDAFIFSVSSCDSSSMCITKSFDIIVRDINEPPTNIQISSTTVLEHAPANTLVGEMSADDPDLSSQSSGLGTSATTSCEDDVEYNGPCIAGSCPTAGAVSSIDACKDLCDAEVKCQAMVYDGMFKTCTLKHARGSANAVSSSLGFTSCTGARVNGYGNNVFSIVSGSTSPFYLKERQLFTNGNLNHERISSYHLTVRACSRGVGRGAPTFLGSTYIVGTSAAAATTGAMGMSNLDCTFKEITIDIQDENDAPTEVEYLDVTTGVVILPHPALNDQIPMVTLAENSAEDTVVARLRTLDPDTTAQTFTYDIIGAAVSGWPFKLTPTTATNSATIDLVVNTSSILDYERNGMVATGSTPGGRGMFFVRVRSADSSLMAPVATLAVRLTNVIEPPVVASNIDMKLTELSAPGTVIGVVEATADAYDVHPLKFAVASDGGSASSFLGIHSCSGNVYVLDDFAPKKDENIYYILNIDVSGESTVTIEVRVELLMRARAPIWANGGAAVGIDLLESVAVDFAVVDTLLDSGRQEFTLTIAETDITEDAGVKVTQVGGAEGTLKIALTGTGMVSVVIEAAYGVTFTDSAALTVGTSTSISDGDITDVSVTSVSEKDGVIDPNGDSPLFFSIVSGNKGGLFRISNTATGKIVVDRSGLLNFENVRTYSLQIMVTDASSSGGSGMISYGLVNVNVQDVNDAPYVEDGLRYQIAENSVGGTRVGTPIYYHDEEIAAGLLHTVSFAITSGNTGAAFDFHSTSIGQLIVAGNIGVVQQQLNYESDNDHYEMIVTATDTGTPPMSGTATVTVALVDVNEPPTFSDQNSFDLIAAKHTVAISRFVVDSDGIATVTCSGDLLTEGDLITLTNSNEWTLTIASTTITESPDVVVTQQVSGATGKLKTGLTGADMTTVVISSAPDVTFSSNAELTIGSSTFIAGSDVTNAANEGSATMWTNGGWHISAVLSSTSFTFDSTENGRAQPSAQTYNVVGGISEGRVNLPMFFVSEGVSVGHLLRNTTDGTSFIVATDADRGARLSYDIKSVRLGEANAFDVHRYTGALKVAGYGLDYEEVTMYEVLIRAMDEGGLSVEKYIAIRIQDENETPTMPDNIVRVINEGSAVGTRVSSLDADPDQDTICGQDEDNGVSGQLLFSITNNPPFSVLADGSLCFFLKATLNTINFESLSSYSIEIRVTDRDAASPLYVDTNIEVNVIDVNEAPFLEDYVMTVRKFSAFDPAVGDVVSGRPLVAVDVDITETTLTYNIASGNNNNYWSLVADSTNSMVAHLTLATANPAAGIETLQVSVMDSQSLSSTSTASVTIKVVESNNPPNIKCYANMTAENSDNNAVDDDVTCSFFIGEDAETGTVAATLGAVDMEGDGMTFSIVAGNFHGAFAISQKNLPLGSSEGADAQGGATFAEIKLTSTASNVLDYEASDASGKSSFSLVVVCLDDNSNPLYSGIVVKISITDQNEAPEVENIRPAGTYEYVKSELGLHTTEIFAVGTVYGAETCEGESECQFRTMKDAELFCTIVTECTAIHQHVQVADSTNTRAYFCAGGKGCFAPRKGPLGTYDLAWANIGGVSYAKLDISNTITASVLENAVNFKEVVQIISSDPDGSSDVSSFSIKAGNDEGFFNLDEETGKLCVADGSLLTYQGNDVAQRLTVEVEDTGGIVVQVDVLVRVVDANEAPTLPLLSTPGASSISSTNFVRYVSEDARIGDYVGTKLIVYDADQSDGHTWSVLDSTSNTGNPFSFEDGTGQLVVTGANGANLLDYEYESQQIVTIQVNDDGTPSMDVTGTIQIYVLDENEAPVFDEGTSVDMYLKERNIAGTPVTANTPVGSPLRAMDPDVSQSIRYSLAQVNLAATNQCPCLDTLLPCHRGAESVVDWRSSLDRVGWSSCPHGFGLSAITRGK